MRVERTITSAPSPTWSTTPLPESVAVRLQGRRLLLARVTWLVLAILAVGLFIASLPARYNQRLQSADTATQAAALTTIGLSARGFAASMLALETVLPLSFIGIAAIIFWRKSDEWPPLLFSHLLVVGGITSTPILRALETVQPQSMVLIETVQIYGAFGFFLFADLFPDGHFVPRWIVLPGLFWLAINIGEVILGMPWLNPDTWPRPISIALLLLITGSLPFAQIYRYCRVSSQVQRQQTKWVMFGFSAAILVNVSFILLDRLAPAVHQSDPVNLYVRLLTEHVTICAFMLVPLSIGVATLRYRLWDIDTLISRTLVYSILTACVIGIYVMVVGYLGAVFRAEGNLLISLVATGVVAVLFQPLRSWLQHRVNRLVYGDRDDPYAVIVRLGQRLESTIAANAVLPTIVETVSHALKLPYVAITLNGESSTQHVEWGKSASPDVIESGELADAVRSTLYAVPLTYQGDLVGELLLAPRAPGEALTPADHQLLHVLAPHAATAAHAARLTADLQQLAEMLQHARAQLVTSREEERRRLRRDLHDGVGPTLSSLVQRLDLARNLVVRDPAAAEQVIIAVKAQVKHTLTDIRRLVYALRPPVLDELGLVGALREHILHVDQVGRLHVMLHAPDPLPSLPAAVEVAAYRISMEALTNVVRHAQACTCQIELALLQEPRAALQLRIVDDGVGLPHAQRVGVGTTAMRERAEELGGTCTITARSTGGVAVLAVLPV